MSFIKFFKEELAIIKDRDPAIKSDFEALLYPSFWAILGYRRAHKHYLKGHYFRARRISQKIARKTGIEIHPGAQIVEKEENLTDDLELVAVITAAIAASEGTSADGLYVRSIKRVNKSKWQRA